MRLIMKGGVWKNAEDEVLKAAVMKYGINNWSRVASLLVRKSARQCKARWYEWLDPSVKKTPWSKKEDEKLLNMAKLFPTQWKTIAPLVGRTSHQCLERYGQLLDIASGKDPNNLDEDDPRRLRPGEVDPNPETKLARADAVDLDDDEREMLAEARARLANTRGKKAKRKAREKQLQEARRVAVSQKRRELKAAGISVSAFRRGRRDGGIDYANEIPFEVKPLPGMHRVGAEETPNADANISNMRLQQLEESRQKATMLRLKIQDRRALKKLHDQDLPGMMRKNAEETDPFAIRKRTELTLPAPVVGDAELRDLTTAIDQANSLLDSTTDGNALSGLLQGAKGTRALLLGSSTVAAATTPLLSRGKSALTGGVTSTGGITATPKVAADGRSGRVTRKKERKGEITVASLLSGLPAALNEVTTDMSTADIEEADLEVDDDVEEDERDKEIKIKRRKQQLIEHLSHIHRRQEIFSEHLPRPLDLPHSMAEIQALLTVGDVTFEEQLIIQETAQLIYRDENEFLPAEEHLKVFSTPKSLLQSNFMPEAFLAFCGRAFKDVSMRHCLTAAALLDDESASADEVDFVCADPTSRHFDGAKHKAVYHDGLQRYEVLTAFEVPSDTLAEWLRNELEVNQMLIRLNMDKLRAVTNKGEVLTRGYRVKTNEKLATLDKIYLHQRSVEEARIGQEVNSGNALEMTTATAPLPALPV